MKIICAGRPRTGTKSLAAALKYLGFTVDDHIEHMNYHIDEYSKAIDGKMPDFYAMYKDVDVTIATPSCFYWKELKETFPDAKVILTERDNADAWVNSFISGKLTVNRAMASFENRLAMFLTPTGRKWLKIQDSHYKIYNIMKYRHRLPLDENASDDEKDLRQRLTESYTRHNAQVKASIPPDQLLVFNVKQGWKPLCEFLGVDAPDEPFPRLNVKNEKMTGFTNQTLFGNPQVTRELNFILVISIVFVAFVIFIIYSQLI